MEILLLGPQSSGKTLFTKQFKEFLIHGELSAQDIPATIPTVGTNMTVFNLSRRESANIRELGGLMAPIWNKYFTSCKAVIFMLDKSNPQQLSADAILLLDILSSPQLSRVPVLIVWNKVDCSSCLHPSDITNIIDMDLLKQKASQPIHVTECSSTTTQGFKDILHWIRSLGSSH